MAVMTSKGKIFQVGLYVTTLIEDFFLHEKKFSCYTIYIFLRLRSNVFSTNNIEIQLEKFFFQTKKSNLVEFSFVNRLILFI